MFEKRTSKVEEGTKPYAWGVPTTYQCTWYGYYRAMEVGFTPPVWWDRATKTGSYPNAKDWLANFREPWEVKGTDYVPKAGDIVVWDGEYGHIQFMETEVMYSEYSSGNPDSFRNGKLSDYKGKLLGYLHYPYESVNPVERNEKVDQIQTLDDTLRIRTEPSLEAEVVGYVQLGFYNVLSTKKADGYTWYKIATDRWCANVSVKYLPKGDDDIIKVIEEYFDRMKEKVSELTNENEDLNERLDKIKEICDGRNHT